MYLGATVVVNTFQFVITAYKDAATQVALSRLHEQTLGIVQGQAFANLGKIISATNGFGFTLTKLQTVNVTDATQSIWKEAGITVANGPTAIMVLLRLNAVEEWQKLSARFGDRDGVFASVTVADAQRAINHLRSSVIAGQTSALCNKDSTLCLIKPHIVQAGQSGAIIQKIAQNMPISAVEQVHVTKEDAFEFLNCYRGVLPEFGEQIEALYSGSSIAVEINDVNSDDVVEQLRQLAGPFDVTCAKCLAPDTLRATFGLNNVDNAVHVTDLPTDGQIETNFFFRVLKT